MLSVRGSLWGSKEECTETGTKRKAVGREEAVASFTGALSQKALFAFDVGLAENLQLQNQGLDDISIF